MTTNLIATIVVTLVTNVTTTVPQHLEQPVISNNVELSGARNAGDFYFHMVDDPDPREKWVNTTVKKVTTLSVVYEGQTLSWSGEEIATNSVEHFVLKRTDQWEKVK